MKKTRITMSRRQILKDRSLRRGRYDAAMVF